MKQKNINAGYGYVLRLEKGEFIREKILQFAGEEDVLGAYFFGIGAVEGVKIGCYDSRNKKYIFSEYEGDYELASLQGNISSYEGTSNVHMHAVLNSIGDTREVISGHLDDAKVLVTLEIFVHILQGVKLHRKIDSETGLPLLEF